MSPMAMATVVDVVGAETPNVDSSDSGIVAGRRITSGRFASNGHFDASVCAVSAIIVISSGKWGVMFISSAVLPEYVMKRRTSFCANARVVSQRVRGRLFVAVLSNVPIEYPPNLHAPPLPRA
jgi:hypothetical protein